MSVQRVIKTDNAPKAIGPYSQAILQDGWLYASGQIGMDPASGELRNDDLSEEVEQVFSNLRAVLRAAGAELNDVVRCTVYMTDLGEFQTMNSVYARHFEQHKPARATVGVSSLPKGARVEIDCVAFLGRD